MTPNIPSQQPLSTYLITLGVKRTTALVIEAMSDHSWMTMRDIERKADIRQGEVSLVIKELNGYIKTKKAPSDDAKAGRPIKLLQFPKVEFARYAKNLKDKVITKQLEEDEALEAVKARSEQQ